MCIVINTMDDIYCSPDNMLSGSSSLSFFRNVIVSTNGFHASSRIGGDTCLPHLLLRGG